MNDNSRREFFKDRTAYLQPAMPWAVSLDSIAKRQARTATNKAIDAAWPFAPFEAWDMIAQERVTVIGWYDTHNYRLASGIVVRLDTITSSIPQWLINAEQAEQAEQDADDENKTRQALREAMQ